MLIDTSNRFIVTKREMFSTNMMVMSVRGILMAAGLGSRGNYIFMSSILKGNIPRISSYTWLFEKNTGWFVVLRSNP